MKLVTSPLAELKHARECIALETFSPSGMGEALKRFLPGIFDAFASNKVAAELPELVGISADQTKFLKLIAPFPYTELMGLRAFQPEGVNVPYLEYLRHLVPVAAHLSSIQTRVIQPYLVYLAHLVSNQSKVYSSDTNAIEYGRFEKFREATYAAFSKAHLNDSFAATGTVGSVIERNADWPAVFAQAKQCTDLLNGVSLADVKSQMKQATDYLEVLRDSLQAYSGEALSKSQIASAGERLSSGAYQVAKELEFFATTYYRALALNAAVDNTVNHIRKSIG